MFGSLLNPSSYFGLFLGLVATGCCLPIPEEAFLILAGVLSSQEKLDPWYAFGACLAGALVGDAIMYQIGARFGHGLAMRHPKFAKLVGADREQYFEQAVERHGFKVLLLARFMVGVRGPVYLAAGMIRMPFRRFLVLDAICATLVVAVFFGLAYFYGEEIAAILRDAEKTITLAVLLGGLAAALYFLRRQRRRLVERLMDSEAEPLAATEQPPADAPQREAS
ncbi:MAG: DedA family protein [Pirellulales bacterium]|mgnify:CR=1 FL=1|nr:DedA family protein [Pirellulales bacterium]MBX3432785.1 DedA family protein [Pirellulales bacterium]